MECRGCGYIRKDTDTAPVWQCPSCEIAYYKSEELDIKQPSNSQPFVKKNFTIIFILVNLILGLFFIAHYNTDRLNQSPTYSQEDSQLDLDTINISLIEAKLDGIHTLTSKCKVNVEIYGEKNHVCSQAAELFQQIQPEISSLRDALNKQQDKKITLQTKWSLNRINYFLEEIDKDFTTINLLLKK